MPRETSVPGTFCDPITRHTARLSLFLTSLDGQGESPLPYQPKLKWESTGGLPTPAMQKGEVEVLTWTCHPTAVQGNGSRGMEESSRGNGASCTIQTMGLEYFSSQKKESKMGHMVWNQSGRVRMCCKNCCTLFPKPISTN